MVRLGVPDTITKWKEEVRMAQADRDLNEYAQPPEKKSASRFEAHHFLALRVLWKVTQLPRDLTFDKLPKQLGVNHARLALYI